MHWHSHVRCNWTHRRFCHNVVLSILRPVERKFSWGRGWSEYFFVCLYLTRKSQKSHKKHISPPRLLFNFLTCFFFFFMFFFFFSFRDQQLHNLRDLMHTYIFRQRRENRKLWFIVQWQWQALKRHQTARRQTFKLTWWQTKLAPRQKLSLQRQKCSQVIFNTSSRQPRLK